MQKTTIVVPKGIRYIGDWKEFQLSNFPAKCIINKVLPGCGFTRYCIDRQFENVILCSPRKMLLQNKYDQHKTQAYLVVNEYDQDPGIDMDITKERKVVDKRDQSKEAVTEVKSKLHTELRQYMSGHLQWKILVTYDSFRILKEVLIELGVFDRFFVVIDEMQAVMQDARFKSSTEISFLYHLQESHSALFVSATPMLEEYLDQLDEFKDLPYFEFDWKTEDFSRIVKPDLDVWRMRSITSETKKILDRFLKGEYDELTILENGQPKVKRATQLVFYVNSVAAIIKIISASGLSSDQVNILCSNTEENQNKIWKRLRGNSKNHLYEIGRVPIKGEKPKPITLCTRTVYLGADFYSDCAKSYIFSDPNSDYLSVDISQDLPQILGRQRCDENPWKNSATLFYRTTSKEKSRDEFNKIVERKDKETQNVLNIWGKTTEEGEKATFIRSCMNTILVEHYREDYIALNSVKMNDPVTGEVFFKKVPVINNLVKVAEKRAFDIQQIDYADRFSVFMTLSKEFGSGFNRNSCDQNPIEFQVTEFFKVYEEAKRISERLKLLCEVSMTDEARSVILAQLPDTEKVKYLYQAAGPERCRANSYIPKKISIELGIKFFSKEDLAREIYQKFTVGQKISLSDAKSILKDLYSSIGYDKSPKATDLQIYFETKDVKTVDPSTKKRLNSYELIKKLL